MREPEIGAEPKPRPKPKPKVERPKREPPLPRVPPHFEESEDAPDPIGDSASHEQLIERMAGIHMKPREMALILGISESEVKTHATAMERGLAKAKFKVSNGAFLTATDRNHPKHAMLTMFWAKCHMGWNDQPERLGFGAGAADADAKHLTDEVVMQRFEDTIRRFK